MWFTTAECALGGRMLRGQFKPHIRKLHGMYGCAQRDWIGCGWGSTYEEAFEEWMAIRISKDSFVTAQDGLERAKGIEPSS
jgi:hypothetical protein